MKSEDTTVLRRRLKRTWLSFFFPFSQLTSVQKKVVPLILDGHNVVVASPTASGKTEAVVAPVAERCLEAEEPPGVEVLYVVPTRALANDVVARIEGPLNDLGRRVSARHGDKPHISQTAPPHWMVTTPESLDSLLCRRPTLFRSLRYVILDEVHLVDGSYRGDQVRVLLRRLRSLTAYPLVVHVLSATLGAPEEVGSRYVDTFATVVIPDARTIEAVFLRSTTGVCHYLGDHRFRKVLCFCNSRRGTEEFATQLREAALGYEVVVHHGSLARHERSTAEEMLRTSGRVICVATSTLEVGIDVGDIDLVVLVDPPHSISSFLQRVGRGSRRDQTVRVVLRATTDEEENLLQGMVVAAQEGAIPPRPYYPDLSVVVQQVFSWLYQQKRPCQPEELWTFVQPLCTEDELTEILAHLRQKDYLGVRAGRYYGSEKIFEWGEKGRIHSNIPDQTEIPVIDVATEREVGKIFGDVDRVFVLAGRAWEVVQRQGYRILVKRFTGKAEPTCFQPRPAVGAFFFLLPPRLRQRVLEQMGD